MRLDARDPDFRKRYGGVPVIDVVTGESIERVVWIDSGLLEYGRHVHPLIIRNGEVVIETVKCASIEFDITAMRLTVRVKHV